MCRPEKFAPRRTVTMMENLRKHDEVMLCIGKDIVGCGTVMKVMADDHCQGQRLGDTRIAVLVDDAFDEKDDLPYPTKHATKLFDAKDIIVLWDRVDVFLQSET